MLSRRLTDERLFSIAREVEAGSTMQDVCHRYRISEAVFCAGMMSSLEQPLPATSRKKEHKSSGMFMVNRQWHAGLPSPEIHPRGMP